MTTDTRNAEGRHFCSKRFKQIRFTLPFLSITSHSGQTLDYDHLDRNYADTLGVPVAIITWDTQNIAVS